jgi:TolA-binding protein
MSSALLSAPLVFAQGTPAYDVKQFRNLELVITESEVLLERYPRQDFTPTVMYQLLELYVSQTNLIFERQMLVFEEAERKVAAGDKTRQPQPPVRDYTKALTIGHRLLDEFPDIPFKDKIYYRIAYCYYEANEHDKAAAFFRSLASETTEQALLEEANFRLGEYAFDNKKYNEAVTYYDLLLKNETSPYFNMALYKLAWSYYNLEDYAGAISTFLFLIEDIALTKNSAEKATRSGTDLWDEAIKNVALCFAEFGGPSKAREFLKGKQDRDYVRPTLEHLAGIYKGRNYYQQSIETFRLLLDFFPGTLQAPQYQQQIVENYRLASDNAKADEARWTYINAYGPGTKWIATVKDSDLSANTIETAENYLFFLGTEAHRHAQTTDVAGDYQEAIDDYLVYLTRFPDWENSTKVQYYLAECYYKKREFGDAAAAYQKVATKFQTSEFREPAAYNRILAHQEILRQESTADSMDFFLFNFLGLDSSRADVVKVVNNQQAQLLQAMNDYIALFPQSNRTADVAMNYGDIFFSFSQYRMAEEVFRYVISDSAAQKRWPIAYMKLAQCDFQQAEYQKAEAWASELLRQFPDSTRFVTHADKLIASAKFKSAERTLSSGDSLSAASSFEKIASEVKDDAIAERALFQAAVQFEKSGDKGKASALYKRLADRFPNSTLADESLYKAATLSESVGAWADAASIYRRLYERDKNAGHAQESLYNTARCLENAQDRENARTAYLEYVKKYDDPFRRLEAAFKSAEIANQLGQKREAKVEFNNVVNMHQKYLDQGAEVDNYLAANAQFFLAELEFEAFEKIQLTPPLERKMKQKKDTFENVIKAYAASAKYKVAEWTTASSFKIGQTFENFANAIMDAPKPRNLTNDELKQYNQKLLASVLPFKEKALATYQSAVKQADDNKIENLWVTESRKRIVTLIAEVEEESRGVEQKSGS